MNYKKHKNNVNEFPKHSIRLSMFSDNLLEMAEGRAGPRAGPGRAEILEKLGGPGRAGPQFRKNI